MDITRAQQIELDDALVTHANRLTIGKSNLRLSLDLKSKEPTLQVVYDVLKLTPFYKAFQIIADVLEIYMQEFWATATVHHHSIRFKMNNKKHIVNLDGEIEVITDVNVKKLHQPWRSFATVINKCLSDKSIGYDTLRLSQAQILWGMYHKKNVDYAYLLWKDFIYQVKNKNAKRSNKMYYPRFTKVIVNFFMTKDPSIPRRNRVNWNFARDDPMFTMIKVVSRHEDTQLYGAILPDELTNEAIKDSESYKEYYAIASGAEPPKTKATKAAKPAKKKQPTKTSKAKGLTVLFKVALTEAEQMKLATKRSLIQTHSSHASDSSKSSDEENDDEVGMSDDDDDNDDDDDDADNQDDDGQDDDGQEYDGHDYEGQDDDNEQNDSDNDGDDFVHPKFSTYDQEERQDEEDNEEEGSDMRVQTPSHYESTVDEESDEVTQGGNVEGEELNEETYEEEEVNELYRDVNVNLEGRDTEMTDAQQTHVHGTHVIEDTHLIMIAAALEVQQQSSSVSSGFISNMFNLNPDTCIDFILNLNNESPSLVDVPVTTTVEMPPSSAITIPPPPKIIKEQVKAQVKEQVTKILPRIEKTINEQLEAEILTRSSNEAKTSHAVAANLSELELKKILIDKMESNKSIHRSDHQKTLYKALVDAYESDKLILDTYGDTVTIKRRRDDQDEDEEPSAGSNRGSKRRRAGKEPESTSAPKEKTSKSSGKSKEGSKSHHTSTGKSAQAEEPIHADKDLEEPAHQDNLARKEDTCDSFNELLDTPLDFLAFVMNLLKVDTLTPEFLAGPTFELMKGSCKSLVELEYFLKEIYKATTDQLDWNNPEGQQYPHDLRKPLPLIPNSQGRRVIPFDHFINNDLAYLRGGTSSRTYATLVTKTKAADYGHVKWIEDLVPNTMWSAGICSDVYSRHMIIVVTKLQIVEWHNYKHLDWINVRRNDYKLYTFKEGDYKRLRLQDIKDMLLLLVQGKLINLTIKERLALNVSLRMFTRSIVIQRRVEDLQLGVESYQKKLNRTRPDTQEEQIDAYQDLDDILKRIRMKYRPQTHRFSNPMIKPEPEGSTQGYPLDSVEVLRFDTTTRNHVKEILPKLNLPDHKSILTDSKEFIKMDMEVPDPN
ncbi:hypothetical protein Tco_1245501 [Tanacetum coccineum]